MSRTKNAIKMVASSSINQLITVIAGLILPPLFISHYGSEVNGLVNSVKQILSYFSVVSVGLGAASQVALYKPLATQDWSKISAIIAELTCFLNKVGVVFATFISIFAFVLPIARKDDLNHGTVVGIVIICGIGSLIEFVCLTRYKILLAADQKQFIVSNVYTQGTIINTTLSIILIEFNATVLMVQSAASLAYLIRMLLLKRKVHILYPLLKVVEPEKESCVNNTKEALVYKLADIIINYIPVTLVTFICGYIDVSIYTVYNLVFAAIVMIVNIFSTGLSASFGNQIAQNDYDGLKKSFRGYNFVFRTTAFFFYACAAILIIPFVSIYISNNDGVNYIIPAVGIMFALNGICRVVRTPYITLIDAVGNYTENIKANYIEVIINIIISTIMTMKYGMIGVLIGGTIAAFIRSVWFLLDVNRKIVKISSFKDLYILGVNSLVGVFMYMLLNNININGYIGWFLVSIKVAIICGVIFGGINILLDFQGFKEIMKRICGLKK